MLPSTKRTLRNGNTCPNVPNPLVNKQTAEVLREFLPGNVKNSLGKVHSLCCNQVNSLPTFSLPRSAEQALKIMQSATQWQCLSVNGNSSIIYPPQQMQKTDEKQIRNAVQLDVVKKQTKVQPQNSIYSVLFQNQLHDFIMNPPPASYDFEYLYHQPTPEIAQEHEKNAYFDH